jgi:Tfp pilus assembly protein FimV
MAQPVPPREALAAAIQARTEAQKAVADLEAGLTAARTLLATAQAARNEAAAAEQTAKASAATYLARSFLNRAQDGPEPSQAAARAALAAAEDRFDAVGTARGELEMQLISAKQSHGIATERARNAAASVLGAELGGHLVERATAARDDFVAAVHGLSWLGRQHVPLDAAAARLIASLEMRPSQWPSPPPSTDWPALMATLLNDAKAAIGPP